MSRSPPSTPTGSLTAISQCTFTIDLPKKLIAVARALGCLEPAQFEILGDLRGILEARRPKGMTVKNREVVRQVLTSGVWGEIVRLPAALMAKARVLQDTASRDAAMLAQLAVAIAI